MKKIRPTKAWALKERGRLALDTYSAFALYRFKKDAMGGTSNARNIIRVEIREVRGR